MAAPTSYQDPPPEARPTFDFFRKQESLRAGRHPAIIGHFSQDREVLDGEGVPDTNVFGLPLYERASLGTTYSLLIDSSHPAGLQRLALMMDGAAERYETYAASGQYPSPGMALEAAIADEWYELRDLCLAAPDAAALAALGVTPQGDHPFTRT